MEQRKPRAQIGLVLRTLKTLGVSLDIAVDRAQKASAASEPRNVNMNNILTIPSLHRNRKAPALRLEFPAI